MAEADERRRRRSRRESMMRTARPIASMSETTKTLLCCTFLMMFVMVHIAMIAIGSMYLKDCPKKRVIPIYLVVAGVLGMVSFLLLGLIRYYQHIRKTTPLCLQVCNAMVQAAYFCMLITGAIYVYSFPDKFQRTPFCKHGLYLFAFWIITLTLAILILLMIFCCINWICILIIAEQERKRAAKESQAANESQETNKT